ncbi:MAG: glycoside hydrolase family 130 protein [Deltaproteobacteria bacterium]|nr:glycoside hydrolase family 130 protein [Deltaproteobacteria bacterium]
MNKLSIIRSDAKIEPVAFRVLIRPFIPSQERVVKILARIAAQPDEEVQEHLDKIFADFSGRHIEVKNTFLERYDSIKHLQFTDFEPSLPRKLLIGSYFTSEYSLESAALFNPSMVPHPDQAGLPDGSVRFVMSLRAVGEGHISSVVFRSGTVDKNHNIKIDQAANFVTRPDPIVDKEFKNKILRQKIFDMGFENQYSNAILALLPERFTFQDIHSMMKELNLKDPALSLRNDNAKKNLLWLASANYDIKFSSNIPIGGRALFPYSPSEKHGIEDARFVRFKADDGEITYFGTATAWDGKTILSQIIETKDFLTFKVRSLNGAAVKNKGMALFPRKIDGKYAMISRQDNENIYLMYSDHVQFWREAQLIIKPTYPWEYYQMGNCGPPIEVDEGWLLITHGVGAMRRYAIGAVLLDKGDPSRVIGRVKEPFLVPIENEREGYVPNVVYSCGSMIHRGKLILPYAMADYASRIALVDVKELVTSMLQ